MFNRFRNGRAFASFFDAKVGVEAIRDGVTYRGIFAACVFPGTAADPLAAVVSTNETITATVLISKVGPYAWNLTTPPRKGDKITHEGHVYAVNKRDEFVRDHHHLEVALIK